MRKQEKEKVGEYEVVYSLRLGGKVLLTGCNEKNTEAPYMTCCKVSGPFGEVYGDMVIGSDYLAIMRLFSDRLQEQVKSVERTRAEHNVPLETLGMEHCRKRGEEENLAGNLIIIRSSSLAPEYRTADCQLGYATGGFGCSPGAGGRAVYFRELISGEECRWNIGDVLGIADMEKLPEWAKQKVAEHEKARAERKKERGEAR